MHAWGYRCERITKLQKRIVRILSLSKYNDHTEPIFKTLKLLKVIDILNLLELQFYYKYKNNLLPYYLKKSTIPSKCEQPCNKITELFFSMETYARICQKVYTI